ncbi:uncharacterized protein A1O9_01734 [Exophiala aquamarina CBS 119918]|uniref:Uncharacterized protein n=1 Tax=Exophiala aquamarina CBS 119918 TaxID=1182545 RepID=A0A072PVA3_9EURO|nr:uncharacterized protein A1O9_01734 [Exophiala aquamarina CBS 119918]KEF63756.1 hypothetical protein A1O9_01734 [Exophiala aquamarina CBS 119918]
MSTIRPRRNARYSLAHLGPPTHLCPLPPTGKPSPYYDLLRQNSEWKGAESAVGQRKRRLKNAIGGWPRRVRLMSQRNGQQRSPDLPTHRTLWQKAFQPGLPAWKLPL